MIVGERLRFRAGVHVSVVVRMIASSMVVGIIVVVVMGMLMLMSVVM